MTGANTRIETEQVNACVACGQPGQIAFQDCFDHVCGLPGNWTFWKCPSCRSLWPNPRPVESALPLLYPENYTFTRTDDALDSAFPTGLNGSIKLAILERFYGYDFLTQNTDRPLGISLGRMLGWLFRCKAGHSVRFLRKRADGKLLDVGCGNGAFIHWMQRLGWNVEGIEVDRLAAQRAIDRGLAVHIGNVEDIDLPSASFDAITLTHVTEHLFHPKRIFEILRDSLKPGGILISISPNPAGIVRRIFQNKWYALDPPRHLFLPSAAAYRRMLEPLGFEVATWTSMRLFHWVFKESLSIATKRGIGCVADSVLLKLATRTLAALFSCLPEAGEEVICYATKR
jgi:SAM-dependent methyltransferase